MSETVIDRVIGALDAALQYDPNVLEPPVALLWPDKTHQWKEAVEALRARRRLVTLGDYNIEHQRGPALWVRCVVAGTTPLDGARDGVPIVYLPGVSRDDLRTVAGGAHDLAPLAGIQHQSQWFSHPNGKDWTVRALFANRDRGLDLNVASDDATGTALVASLRQLLVEPMSRLKGRHLDAAFLNNLLNPDPIRLLLRWIDDPVQTRNELGDTAWKAFIQQCKTDYNFDPAVDGVIDGARRLGTAEGPWARVWQRFRESPTDYPDIPSRLREAQPSELLPPNHGAWPTLAGTAEDTLRAALTDLADAPASEARAKVLGLEDEHKGRRSYVWADLGWTPLALALEHLAELARHTEAAPASGSVAEIAAWYEDSGWRVDGAVLAALDEVDRKVDIGAVAAVLTAVYRPWLDDAAKALQAAVGPEANAGTYHATANPSLSPGEVALFVDGLRLDVARRLADRLRAGSVEVALSAGLAALPTVTQTAKPVLAPIEQGLLAPGKHLDACRAPEGPTAGAQVLRSLMADADVQVLSVQEAGDPTGRAWTEAGEIDHKGHDLGFRLAHEIDDQIDRIVRRVKELLEAGWSKVTVLTDHGWLLLPGGLPKNHGLPVAATVVKKGRCARVKDGAVVDVPTVPWYWNRDVRIAVAPGISCFEANQPYEHGGVSPQECVVPRLTVTASGDVAATAAEITKLKWRGLTLVVEFSDLPDGTTVDLRHHPGDAASSIAERTRMTGGTGKEILLVEDEDLEGTTAYLVVVAAAGTLLLQRETVVAQNR